MDQKYEWFNISFTPPRTFLDVGILHIDTGIGEEKKEEEEEAEGKREWWAVCYSTNYLLRYFYIQYIRWE